MIAAALALALLVPVPIDPPIPTAVRLEPPVLVAPEWSRCPELYDEAVENWPGAEEVWATLDLIFWRESRCTPAVVNRFGCVGVMQVCRINHKRLGVTRADLQDAGTNIAIGYQLCQEWVERGRSCWRPWYTKKWRP